MLFLSNFGRKIIFTCSVNFWHPQDSNSFSLKQALITWPLSASEISSKVTITLSWKQLFLACLWHWKIFMSDQLFAPPIEGFNCLFFLAVLKKENVFILQLFRERLSEKVRATVLKGIVGGVEFTVLCSSEKFDRMAREAIEHVCEC